MCAQKLGFDIEQIRRMRDRVDTLSTELQTLDIELQRQVKELRVDWNTPAGKKFCEEQNLDWSDEVKRYVETLNTLREMLGETIIYYGEVQDRADALRLPI